MKVVSERFSCRSYSIDRLPNEEQIAALIEAARLAPSACNRQPWRFVVIRPGDEAGRKAVAAAYPREWVETAPYYIVVCAVPTEAWVRPHDGKNHSDIRHRPSQPTQYLPRRHRNGPRHVLDMPLRPRAPHRRPGPASRHCARGDTARRLPGRGRCCSRKETQTNRRNTH